MSATGAAPTGRARRQAGARRKMVLLAVACAVAALVPAVEQLATKGVTAFTFRPPGVGASPDAPDTTSKTSTSKQSSSGASASAPSGTPRATGATGSAGGSTAGSGQPAAAGASQPVATPGPPPRAPRRRDRPSRRLGRAPPGPSPAGI